ncbi:hypothetical protein TIFTF001_010051 [Ficus carica]|uniref:Uncharacterized protein n=1 Tax=Ficus carica TaxID=3494 RepID=A0AA87ZPB6_FICCA|nr:hypothetical protein TIFTF001_010051 [Ficus carica]
MQNSPTFNKSRSVATAAPCRHAHCHRSVRRSLYYRDECHTGVRCCQPIFVTVRCATRDFCLAPCHRHRRTQQSFVADMILLVAPRIRPNRVAIHDAGDNVGVHNDGVVTDNKTKIDLGERRVPSPADDPPNKHQRATSSHTVSSEPPFFATSSVPYHLPLLTSTSPLHPPPNVAARSGRRLGGRWRWGRGPPRHRHQRRGGPLVDGHKTSLAFPFFQCTMFVGGRRRECWTSSVVVGGGRACSQRWLRGDLALFVAPVARGLRVALTFEGDFLGGG